MTTVRHRTCAEAIRPKQKRGTPLAKEPHASYSEAVVPVNVLAEKLRTEFAEQASKKGSALKSVDAALLVEITSACARVLASVCAFKDDHIVDEVSGLTLPPPPPEVLYKDRKRFPALKHAATPEAFIANTAWFKYQEAGLLAVDFIRANDESLYLALSNRARGMGKSLVEFLDELNILSRYALLNPAPEQASRVAMIRAAQSLAKATLSLSSAKPVIGAIHTK